ncbi:hypothetical protein GYH30_033807 [Glycine max]|uniref:MLO-like protein n=2 Tax=Glycine subgen. Soja TaxID=1462606 RepID=K7LV11_SOYBN|nr:hypothetical protein GYH30_033807 [Glycine max]RZB75946.1 MLO-like protein 14 [Glycine soja]
MQVPIASTDGVSDELEENAFELASFFWSWWQFGYNSCFIRNNLLMYLRLILGFAEQFLCSYSTFPLYTLVTQMGTNFKAALIPEPFSSAPALRFRAEKMPRSSSIPKER